VKKNARKNKQNRQFRETIPLKSLNNSIDFVQQFHWFRRTIPLVLFRQTAAFAAPIRRFRPLLLAIFEGALTFLVHHNRIPALPFPRAKTTVRTTIAPKRLQLLSRK